jgi:hypothetical protein
MRRDLSHTVCVALVLYQGQQLLPLLAAVFATNGEQTGDLHAARTLP